MEATKNICYLWGKSAVDHRTINRWFNKFCLGCKNLDDQARSDKPKTVGFLSCAQSHRGKSGE